MKNQTHLGQTPPKVLIYTAVYVNSENSPTTMADTDEEKLKKWLVQSVENEFGLSGLSYDELGLIECQYDFIAQIDSDLVSVPIQL